MIEHTQTILFNDPEGRQGNCWQTAIASVLELPLDDVPHFIQIDEDGGRNWWMNTWEWLNERGYTIEVIPTHPDSDELYFVTGPSPRGNFHHVVVYCRGKMVHDPHPDRTGVVEEEYFEVIRKKV